MTDISVCIVTLNARDYLRDCLKSLEINTTEIELEIIVVDNGSTDGVLEMLAAEFPHVITIRNSANLGFTRPTNQAMRRGTGTYFLWLNPDTLIHPLAVNLLHSFMEAHPEAGICGPKILNRDGTLQAACRRGVARPWNAISYFLGLHRLFPKSRLFGGYLLNYLDENETAEVDGVSGSCMLVRRTMAEQIGYMDERYFAYQEDADFCFQAKKAGWKVYYYPESQITHFGGLGGSRAQPYKSVFEWHRSYWMYYRKNLAADYFFLFNWLYYGVMAIKLAITLLANFLRPEKYAGPRRG
jgi:GT2 family glycosyltransferase